MSEQTQPIGAFTFSVTFREPAPEAQVRAERRAEALAAWLLAQWLRCREEVQHVERD
jgi:hypothetical protein